MTEWMVDGWAFGLAMLIGLSGGLAVGGGLVAFLIVLDIIPRLVQMTGTRKHLPWFESAIISGALFWTVADFWEWRLGFAVLGTVFVGLGSGLFVGMLAAALTEVLNVFPILAKRLGVSQYIIWLLMAVILGKVCGSLFHWLYFSGL